MANYPSDHNDYEIKPGGNIAFGGGLINRAKRHGIDPNLMKKFRVIADQFFKTNKIRTEKGYEFWLVGLEMKRQCKHGSFGPMLKDEFPYLCQETMQRWIKIAKNVPFNDYPAFFWVSQTQLRKIIDRFDHFDEAIAILKDNGVSLDIYETNKEQILFNDNYNSQSATTIIPGSTS